MKTVLKVVRGSRKTMLVLLALGGTLGMVHAMPVRDASHAQAAVVTTTEPSMASYFGVGALSLIGMLALRRRVRGFQS